ncbi:hypothetical protein ABE419_25155, partial [Brevibacillus agri]
MNFYVLCGRAGKNKSCTLKETAYAGKGSIHILEEPIMKGVGTLMNNVSNTGRIMKIREILFNHTDENHELSILEIIDHLKIHFGSDYKVSKNTVRSTIQELRECGFSIEESVKGDCKIF